MFYCAIRFFWYSLQVNHIFMSPLHLRLLVFRVSPSILLLMLCQQLSQENRGKRLILYRGITRDVRRLGLNMCLFGTWVPDESSKVSSSPSSFLHYCINELPKIRPIRPAVKISQGGIQIFKSLGILFQNQAGLKPICLFQTRKPALASPVFSYPA